MEYRDAFTLEIKCAATFNAIAAGCTTCNCANGRVAASFANNLIYVASSKGPNKFMKKEDDAKTLAMCNSWFTQMVASFQSVISMHRTVHTVELFSRHGGCVPGTA